MCGEACGNIVMYLNFVVGGELAMNVKLRWWMILGWGDRDMDGWVHRNPKVCNLCVNNLMLKGVKQWDSYRISNLFTHDAANEILVVPLLKEVWEDILVWQ
jgi:hypothetical protein